MSNDLGIDRSGNGNNWTVNNMAFADQVVDSPTNNFATLNPLDYYSTITLSEGNTKVYMSNGWAVCRGTIAMTSGKWYWEVVVGGAYTQVGVSDTSAPTSLSSWHSASGWTYYANTGNKYNNNSSSSYGSSYTTGDIIGVTYDADNGQVTFYKNNVSQGVAYTLTADSISPTSGTVTSQTDVYNFGQDSSFAGNKTAQGNQDGNDIGDFYYTPPTGFLALCTKNLPDVAVTPSEHFNTVLYTGNEATQSITGVSLQPDLVWFKQRNGTRNNTLIDSVRGGTKQLFSNSTGTEETYATAITSFDTDGFTIGSQYNINEDNKSMVAWNWKANGSGSSNTNGSINTTKTSANVDAGFSISTYTGTGVNGTIGHGLSKPPEMVIVKERGDDTGNWYVWHTGFAATDGIFLNLTSAKATSDTYWNDTAPTSSVFSVGTNTDINGTTGTDTYVAYCFHSVDGYSKCSSFVGNGNVDGTFIYTGFRPAFVLVKESSNTGYWVLHDTSRSPTNVALGTLYPNGAEAEDTSTAYQIDILSNGFKQRNTSGSTNTSGATHIYIAFAETPFKYSNAR